MIQTYLVWYKYIGDNANNEAIGIKAENEIEIRVWGMQEPKGMQIHPNKKLKLDKQNNPVLNSSINYGFYNRQIYFLTYLHM